MEILSKYCPEYTAAKRNLGMNSAEFFLYGLSLQDRMQRKLCQLF
jgi:hypothetical protein